MSNYPGATRPYPNIADIRNEFAIQTESEKFMGATEAFCKKENITTADLVNVTLGYLTTRTPPDIEDLAEFMRFLITIYHLNDEHDSPELYEAVKGIPAYSTGRIGYTFRRRRKGLDRGVFIFMC